MGLKTAIVICSCDYVGWFIIGTAVIIVDYIADFMIVYADHTVDVIFFWL